MTSVLQERRRCGSCGEPAGEVRQTQSKAVYCLIVRLQSCSSELDTGVGVEVGAPNGARGGKGKGMKIVGGV